MSSRVNAGRHDYLAPGSTGVTSPSRLAKLRRSGHHGNEIKGQQLLAERGIVVVTHSNCWLFQHVQNACHLGRDGGARGAWRDQAASRRSWC